MDLSPKALSFDGGESPPPTTNLIQGPTKYAESDPDDGLRIVNNSITTGSTRLVNEKLQQSAPAHPPPRRLLVHESDETDKRQQLIQTSNLISVQQHPLMSPRGDTEPTSNRFFCDDDFKEPPVASSQHQMTGQERVKNSPKRHIRLEYLDKDTGGGISSDSETDISFQANVGPAFQSVLLVPKTKSGSTATKCISHSNISEVPLDEVLAPTRQLSLGSLSVRSFDELDDMEHQRVFMSRSSSASLIEELANGNNGDCAAATELEPCSIRNRQKILLSDGTTREIDMKVIEPYKRVLSHGGYLKDGCQNAIVIFSSCFLPDRSRPDYNYVMESLFL